MEIQKGGPIGSNELVALEVPSHAIEINGKLLAFNPETSEITIRLKIVAEVVPGEFLQNYNTDIIKMGGRVFITESGEELIIHSKESLEHRKALVKQAQHDFYDD